MSDNTPDGQTPAEPTPPPAPPAPPAAPYGEQPPAYGAAPTQPYGAAPAQPYGAAPTAPPQGYTTPGYGYGAAPSAAPYGAAPAYNAGYPTAPKTNTLAIVSLVSALVGVLIIPFIGSIVAVITGHMSLGQIKQTGEGGRGMALAGTIVGWVGLGLAILGVILVILVFSVAAVNYRGY